VKNLSQDVKVGLFVLAGFATLLFMSFKMGDLPFSSKDGEYSFIVNFNQVSGVAKSSKVRMQGVEIGEVASISLDNYKVKVVVYTFQKIEIPIDSTATIQTAGLMGDRFINIQPGHSVAMIENGGLLANSIDPVSLDEIMAKLSSALDDVKKFTGGLGGLLGGDGEGTLSSMMANIDGAASLFRQMLSENRTKISDGLSNVKKMSGNLNNVIVENRESFKATMSNLKNGSDKLDDIMASLKNVIGKIESGKGTIGKLVQDEDVYDDLSKTLKGAKGMVNKIDNIQIGLGLRAEGQTKTGKTKSYFSLRIKPREDKYYLFEITEDVRKATTNTTRNTLNSLLYTLLINKRYGDVGIKAGLMESSGGVGLDFYAWRDALQLSTEIFNFSGYDNNADNPQLKITGKLYFQKYLYISVGGDELLNDYYQTFFVGLGMMADEDDLKFFFSLL